VTDVTNGLSFPRLDCAQALAQFPTPTSVPSLSPPGVALLGALILAIALAVGPWREGLGHGGEQRQVAAVDAPPPRPGVAGGTDPVHHEEDSPDTYWRASISGTTLGRDLASPGLQIGAARELRVVGRSPSGRALRVEARGEGGGSKLGARDLRSALGENVIRSTLFEMRPGEDGFAFVGAGRGHGVERVRVEVSRSKMESASKPKKEEEA
jgi:hypothetical protein